MANLKWYTHITGNFQALFYLIKCYLPYPSFHNSLLMGLIEDIYHGRRSGGENTGFILTFCIQRLAWKEEET